MPLTKCIRCKTLFNKLDNPICPDCESAEEQDFETVRTFVYENEGFNATQVAEETGVDLDCVMRMIERGNIATIDADKSGDAATCGQCGAPAISTTKRLCEDCLEKLNVKMMQTHKTLQEEQLNALTNRSNIRNEINKKRIR